MDFCTCKISKTKCNSIFIYNSKDECIAEISYRVIPHLKSEYTWLCAGAGLQKLNKEIKDLAK